MKTFRCVYYELKRSVLDVEAENEDEAEKKAEKTRLDGLSKHYSPTTLMQESYWEQIEEVEVK
tara:strand:+ start:2884 stop:3072 length:189 start_codon:yes stop_codon:yes gene_type:complete